MGFETPPPQELQNAPKPIEEQLNKAVKYKATGTEVELMITDLKTAKNDHYQKAQNILDKASREAAPALARNLSSLPEEIRGEIARLLLDKAPREAAPALARNLFILPEGIQVEIARLLLEKAPREAGPSLAWNLSSLPEEIRGEIENEVKQIAQMVEREKLSQAEKRNPVLYKDVDELDQQFLRREFPKTGTRILLLGKTLINNVILRIIPVDAFISWMKAYRATDSWKVAGFDYVPVEPIIRARISKNHEHVRVYSGVLGVSVRAYLGMYSSGNYHSYVRGQVKKIKDVLEEMGINHGHTHDNNFCILHERTPEGEIDWDKPPRVYCIDFDQSVSS